MAEYTLGTFLIIKCGQVEYAAEIYRSTLQIWFSWSFKNTAHCQEDFGSQNRNYFKGRDRETFGSQGDIMLECFTRTVISHGWRRRKFVLLKNTSTGWSCHLPLRQGNPKQTRMTQRWYKYREWALTTNPPHPTNKRISIRTTQVTHKTQQNDIQQE